MSHSLSLFIIHHGYFAIFLLILAQELGVPIPAPYEFLLMFFGYLAFQGSLALPVVLILCIASSMLGAWILYLIFYGFGTWIMNHPKIPFPRKLVDRLSEKISKHAFWAVFTGRVIPFGRGYICVAAGLMKIKPKTFATATIVSDTLWNGGFVITGFAAGKYWDVVAEKIGGVEHLVLIVIIVFISYFLIKTLIKKIRPYHNHEDVIS